MLHSQEFYLGIAIVVLIVGYFIRRIVNYVYSLFGYDEATGLSLEELMKVPRDDEVPDLVPIFTKLPANAVLRDPLEVL